MSGSDEPRQVNEMVERVMRAIAHDEFGGVEGPWVPGGEGAQLHFAGLKERARRAIAVVLDAAATVVDECNREGPYQPIGAADRIRALGEEPQ